MNEAGNIIFPGYTTATQKHRGGLVYSSRIAHKQRGVSAKRVSNNPPRDDDGNPGAKIYHHVNPAHCQSLSMCKRFDSNKASKCSL